MRLPSRACWYNFSERFERSQGRDLIGRVHNCSRIDTRVSPNCKTPLAVQPMTDEPMGLA